MIEPTDEQYGDGILEKAQKIQELPATGMELIDYILVGLGLIAFGALLFYVVRFK